MALKLNVQNKLIHCDSSHQSISYLFILLLTSSLNILICANNTLVLPLKKCLEAESGTATEKESCASFMICPQRLGMSDAISVHLHYPLHHDHSFTNVMDLVSFKGFLCMRMLFTHVLAGQHVASDGQSLNIYVHCTLPFSAAQPLVNLYDI